MARVPLLLAFTLSTAIPAMGTDSGATAISNKLTTIKIPEIDFRGANIHDVADFLSQQSADVDKEAGGTPPHGVKIVLELGVSSGQFGVPLITFSARDVSLGEVLRIVCAVAELDYRIRDDSVLVADRLYLEATEATFDPASQAAQQLKAAVIPRIDLTGVPVDKAVASLKQQVPTAAAALLALDLKGAQPGDWPPVHIKAEGLNALEALHIVAGLTHMELAVSAHRVALRPIPTPPPVPPDQPVTGTDELTLRTYPRVDSSTSAQPLQMLCACRLLGADPVWQRAKADELRLRAAALARAEDSPREHRARVQRANRINSRVPVSGTHGAYVSLIHGKAEMILVARAPSADEVRLAGARDVPLDVRPAALDAFIFIVNEGNPVTNLTTRTLRAIYTGKVPDWSEVGGEPGELRAFQRNRNSGSQELMESLVMRELKPVDMPETVILRGMGGPFNRISDDPRGLGYSVLFYERRMTVTQGTKLIAVDGVFPSATNVRHRRYPYVTEVYVVTRADLPTGSSAAVLRNWLLSADGQAVVAQSGYVPLNPTP